MEDARLSASSSTSSASFARLIRFDKRGTGMSDPVSGAPTLETRMDDVRAVMDAAGSRRAAFFGLSEGAAMSILFAATYPERTAALVVRSGSPAHDVGARTTRGAGPRRQYQREVEQALQVYGAPRRGPARSCAQLGMQRDDEVEALHRLHPLGASPGMLEALAPDEQGDRRPRCPADGPRADARPARQRGPDRAGRASAVHRRALPAARFVELPGLRPSRARRGRCRSNRGRDRALPDEVWQSGGWERPSRTACSRRSCSPTSSTRRAKASSSATARWRELLERHHALVRRELARFRGREVDTAGDGFFATFDGPARAIRCACAIVDGVHELGLEVRAGPAHGRVRARWTARSRGSPCTPARASLPRRGAGEVLVSSTVKDLVAGSGIAFEDRGAHELKGIPGEWRLYAVERTG